MPWASFLFAYVLGGLTLLPLVLLAGLLHAHLTLPYYETGRPDGGNSDVDTDDDLIQPGDDVSLLQTEKRAHEAAAAAASGPASSARRTNEDDMASGYFAVCREYTPMGINAKPIERTTPAGSTTVAAPSQSVYQTMYKSLFERKTTPKESDSGTSSSWSRKTGNIFFIVLRHGHLMLFDDEEQLEVRHVISLAHHEISIYSGGGVTPEGELYIKKNAICLSRRKDSADLVAADAQPTKPFYLFSENCSAKEDFYFSLLRNQEHTFRDASKDMPPPPQQFEVKDVISLVQKLHSSEDHLQTRWLNAFLGRIFLGIYKTEDIQDYIRGLLMKKISRVKVPSFLTNIAIRKIDTGQGPPFITNPKLREMTVDGEFLAETDIKYTGNFRMEVAATARLDLGARFKAREVDLMLSVTVKRIEGHMLLRVKPPPSNRLWFSFAQLPKMEMVVEPIVSSRQITYTVILRQIENRIKEVVAESLVQPFWDDVPFFRTEDKKWRGGVFEGNEFVAAGGTDTQETDIKMDAKVDVKADTEDDTPLPDIALKTEVIPTMEKSHSFSNSENTTMHKRKAWTETGADGNGLETAASSSVDFKQTANSLSISPQASNENLAAALQTPPKPSIPHKILSTQTPPSYKSPADRTQQHLESQQNTPSRPSQVVEFSQSSSNQSPAQSKSLATPAKNDNSEALSDTEVDRASPTRFNLSANSALATKAAVSSKMTPPVFPEEIELETEPTPYGGRRGTVSSMDSDGNSSTSGLKLGRANTVNSVKSQAGSFLSKTAAFLANSSGSSISSANGNNVRNSRSNSAHDNYSRNNNSSASLESTPAGVSNDGNDNENSGVDSNIGNGATPVSAVPFRASRPDSRYSYNGKTGSISELPEASLPSTSFLDRESSPTPNITKRNTLAAMSSAAAYARNWGINALARRKESNSSTTATAASDSPAIDLSQPMGRGQPLPPIGTPLPPPEKGNRVTSLPVMKRNSLATPLSTPAISQSTPSTGTITAQSSLPASTTISTQSPVSRIPSPLPLRRSPSTASVSSISVAASLSRASSRQSLRQASPIQRKAIEQGSLLPTGDPSLLVVAAPDDFSEPGTPREDEASRDDEWTGTGTGGGGGGGFSPVVRSVSRRSYRRSSYGVFQPPGSASSSSSALGLKRSASRLSNGQRDDDYAASWLDDKS
ncbi:ph domain-containing protein [Ceratocystis lukuohia]|uniref:Ph domain-containing protein n=1 Tax=Ceratocystis lukuohia TaxID=2019550 RepID=A0ABR4MIJ7_9PEZI